MIPTSKKIEHSGFCIGDKVKIIRSPDASHYTPCVDITGYIVEIIENPEEPFPYRVEDRETHFDCPFCEAELELIKGV